MLRSLPLSALMAATVLTAALPAAERDNGSLGDQVDRFSDLMDLAGVVRREYVDPVPLDELWLGALRGMLEQLDPHSRYLSQEEVAIYGTMQPGRGFGYGFDWHMDPRSGQPEIIRVIPGSPAASADAMPGLRILAIDDQQLQALNTADIRVLMAEAEEPLVLTVADTEGAITELSLTRGELEDSGVSGADMLAEDIGYLRLSRFRPGDDDEPSPTLLTFDRAIGTLREQGMRALVLDCRGNPGGSLEVATSLADRFLAGNAERVVPIVEVHSGNNPTRHDVRHATMPGTLPPWPLVVLVDERTASSAEVVAAALQDHRRATVLGRPTQGKTSVQELFLLPSGEGMLLTVARFRSPQGRDLSRDGLQPDIVMPAVPPERRGKASIDAQVQEALRILTALLTYADYAEANYPLQPLR